jgi:hypothetical protein
VSALVSTADDRHSVLAAALAWHQAGCCVVPAAADGTKRPLGAWKQYQAQRPTLEQLHAWFGDGHPGVGLITGAVSGNLEMLELEGRAVSGNLLTTCAEIALAVGLGDVWRRIASGYSEKTPSGGVHFLYRVNGPVAGNTKLAATEDHEALAETRGEGGFTIIAPSHGPVHPTRQAWVGINGGPDTIPTLTVDERDALHDVFRTLDRSAPPPPAPAPFARPGSARSDGDLSPGDDYNARSDWADILAPAGWTLVTSRGEERYWRRPGKPGPGISATTGYGDGDWLYVFSTSTEFTAGQTYTKFAATALLEHGGNYSAAASALRAAGYGSQPKQKLTPLPTVNGAQTMDHGLQVAAAGLDADPGTLRTSWYFHDLTAVITGQADDHDVPTHLARDDGKRLFYPGRINGLIGESESGKSWVALLCVLQALWAGEHVLYLDFEDSAPGIIDRLRLLGATDAQLSTFAYIGPDEALHPDASRDLGEVLASRPWSLIVLDGVNAAMTLLGLDLEKNKDATHFSQTVLRPLKRTGAAVVTIDHVTKNKDTRGNYAIGAQSKRADIDGCSLAVEVVQPFGRGMAGKLRLTVMKDRPGNVRSVCGQAKNAGVVDLVSTEDGVTMKVHAPDLRPSGERPAFRPTAIMEKVSKFLEIVPGEASKIAIEKEVDGRRENVRQALDVLVDERYVERTIGARGAVLHRSVTPYRQADDPAADGGLTPLQVPPAGVDPDTGELLDGAE